MLNDDELNSYLHCNVFQRLEKLKSKKYCTIIKTLTVIFSIKNNVQNAVTESPSLLFKLYSDVFRD